MGTRLARDGFVLVADAGSAGSRPPSPEGLLRLFSAELGERARQHERAWLKPDPSDRATLHKFDGSGRVAQFMTISLVCACVWRGLAC
jgi:hypothetical protein